jgi:type II secretory pathway component PulF
MKLDEFAFVNQQLAGMLKSGLPLEGALRQLAASLERGDLKTELTALEADLAKGTPLPDALARRDLPDLYRRMMLVGVKSGDLPGVLIMLADYYGRMDTLWTRLKGLMVYPAIVLGCLCVLSVALALGISNLALGEHGMIADMFGHNLQERISAMPHTLALFVWFPVGLLMTLSALSLALFLVPGLRRWATWHLPPFREASFARLAGAFQIMLRHGCPLPEAIALAQQLEAGSALAPELAGWQRALGEGHGKPGDFLPADSQFPPLFRVLLVEAGDDLARGFARAAEAYQARATARAEMLLHAALPVAVLVLGSLLLAQLFGPFYAITQLFDYIGGD